MPAESTISLVTDSTASLTREDRERLEISVVNLYVILNGEQRPENEIDDYAAFYKAVLESPQLTTTSQPSIGRSEERRVGKECRSRWSPYH